MPRTENQQTWKTHMTNLRKTRRKLYELQSLPMLDIIVDSSDEDVYVTVEELIGNVKHTTKVCQTALLHNRLCAIRIECPLCAEEICLDRKWNCFICANGHDIKRFELLNPKTTRCPR